MSLQLGAEMWVGVNQPEWEGQGFLVGEDGPCKGGKEFGGCSRDQSHVVAGGCPGGAGSLLQGLLGRAGVGGLSAPAEAAGSLEGGPPCLHVCARVRARVRGEGDWEAVLRSCEELRVPSLRFPWARRPLWGSLYRMCTDVTPCGFS